MVHQCVLWALEVGCAFLRYVTDAAVVVLGPSNQGEPMTATHLAPSTWCSARSRSGGSSRCAGDVDWTGPSKHPRRRVMASTKIGRSNMRPKKTLAAAATALTLIALTGGGAAADVGTSVRTITGTLADGRTTSSRCPRTGMAPCCSTPTVTTPDRTTLRWPPDRVLPVRALC